MKSAVLLVLLALLYHPAPGEDYDEKKLFGEADGFGILVWGLSCYNVTNDRKYIEEAPFLALAHVKAAGFEDDFIHEFWVNYMPKFRERTLRQLDDVTPEVCRKYFGHMRDLHPGYMKLELPE